MRAHETCTKRPTPNARGVSTRPVADGGERVTQFGARHWRIAAAFAAVLLTQGCAVFPRLQALPIFNRDEAPASADAADRAASPRSASIEILDNVPATTETQATRAASSGPTDAEIAALIAERDIAASLPPQPLPQFIDTVFGQLLQVPYATGQGVAERQDIVSMRGPTSMSGRQFFSLVEMTLEQYGLAVLIERGAVRIVQDEVLSGRSPVFIRTRAMPDTPSYSRPVVQFFAVSSLDVGALMELLDQVYPNRGAVRFTARADTNTLLISGSAREVASAAAVVAELDRPRFAGGQIARIQPTYMTVDQLADSLSRTLTTEGYQVSGVASAESMSAIALLPVASANQLMIFAADPEVFARALYWIEQLDRASALGDRDGVFVYQVQNTSAEELGSLIAQVTTSDVAPATGPTPPEEAVRRINGQRVGQRFDATQPPSATTIGAFTIDPTGNRILFRGSPSEFEHARGLLEQLDTVPQQVLVELTVAEVTLTDETRFGIEWFLDQTITNGTLSANTRGGSTRAAGGLGVVASHVFSRGSVEAALNAFASNRNLNILSTPRLVTRSGSQAEILIGADVPIITSQRAADNQSGGDTDILQTVQYRQTGVILNIRPVVYGDRIDIELYQEVSSQGPNNNSQIASPLILNRSVTTQLSLQEGMTAVIGGMMQDNYSREQRGVPGLKDLPLVGAAFRSDDVSGTKTELVILVTPYIIRDAEEMSEFATTYANSVNRQLRRRGPQVYTLYPWRAPFQAPITHRPRTRPAADATQAPTSAALDSLEPAPVEAAPAAPPADPVPATN
jgi:general secretion pathway protein D